MVLFLPKRASSVRSTDETKKCSALHALNLREGILSTYYKHTLSAVTHKLLFPDTCLYRYFSCFGVWNKVCPHIPVTLCIESNDWMILNNEFGRKRSWYKSLSYNYSAILLLCIVC
jgi:hypothetical protein